MGVLLVISETELFCRLNSFGVATYLPLHCCKLMLTLLKPVPNKVKVFDIIKHWVYVHVINHRPMNINPEHKVSTVNDNFIQDNVHTYDTFGKGFVLQGGKAKISDFH